MSRDFNPKEWLTTAEAAEVTGYNVRYLRQLVNQGKVRAIKRGGIFWIEKESAVAYADKMRELGPAKHDPWRAGARTKGNGGR